MLKKTIKYTDFNGVEREETFYFNISEAEGLTLEISTPGGVEQKAKDIIASQDGGKAMAFFTEFIKMSIGNKSPDGKYFHKSDEITNNFVSTQAYSVLLVELMTDRKAVEAFFAGIMPKVPVQEPPK